MICYVPTKTYDRCGSSLSLAFLCPRGLYLLPEGADPWILGQRLLFTLFFFFFKGQLRIRKEMHAVTTFREGPSAHKPCPEALGLWGHRGERRTLL